jgi:predicted amidophosphoribosyltransferase
VALYFDCPLCSFELTAETVICPNCNALFPKHCPYCQADLQAGQDRCPSCKREVAILQRQSARVVQTMLAGDRLVRIAACPTCGSNFDAARGHCPNCDAKICPECQIILLADEKSCPRCGTAETTETEGMTETCPKCRQPILQGTYECPHCHQLLCPVCSAAVSEEAPGCSVCGTEFELICPNCEETISQTAEKCPHCNLVFED